MARADSTRQGPLVRKGTPAAHAISLASRTAGIRESFHRARRRIFAEYGRDNRDAMLVLLLDRYEERLDLLQITADALRDYLLTAAPAPRDENADAWLCANPACRVPMYGRRAGAKTCGSSCRAELSRLVRAGLVTPEGAVIGNGSRPH